MDWCVRTGHIGRFKIVVRIVVISRKVVILDTKDIMDALLQNGLFGFYNCGQIVAKLWPWKSAASWRYGFAELFGAKNKEKPPKSEDFEGFWWR